MKRKGRRAIVRNSAVMSHEAVGKDSLHLGLCADKYDEAQHILWRP
jgi:hypothetical protein